MEGLDAPTTGRGRGRRNVPTACAAKAWGYSTAAGRRLLARVGARGGLGLPVRASPWEGLSRGKDIGTGSRARAPGHFGVGSERRVSGHFGARPQSRVSR